MLKIGLVSGIVPIMIELITFFTWWIARTFFVYDITSLAVFRTAIVLLYLPIAVLGIFVLGIFLIQNFKNITQPVIGILIILLNFPILFGLRALEMKIGSRAYIKIYNHSEVDFLELILKEPDCQKILGQLKQNKTIISYYYPDYKNYNKLGLIGISGNLILVKIKGQTYELIIPNIHPGEMVRLKIDNNFNIVTL